MDFVQIYYLLLLMVMAGYAGQQDTNAHDRLITMAVMSLQLPMLGRIYGWW